MSKKKLYDIGAEVFAKWPGSQMYYPGTIVNSYDKSNESYKVKFENEGDPIDILAKHITKPSQAKSWRSRSVSPARTPGRRKPRSRSKSPTRPSRPRSPARRRSPNRRQRKSKEELSPLKRDEVVQQRDSEVVDNVISIEEKQVISQTKAHTIQEEMSDTVVTRRMTRSVARIQQEVIQQQAAEIKQSADAKEQKQQKENQTQPGWSCQIMAFMAIFLIPVCLMALYLVVGSKKQSFSFTKWPVIPPIEDLFNWRVAVALGFWYDFQFLLTRTPLGKIVKGPVTPDGEQLNYRLNGMIHLFIHLAVIAACTYSKHAFKVAAWVDKYFLSIAFFSIVWSFLTAVLVALKALFDSRVRDKSITPESFLAGKEPNPRILGFDMKWSCARIGCIGWIVLNCLFILKHYSDVGVKMNCAACFVAIGQLVFMLNGFIIEESMIRSPFFNEISLGFGYILSGFSFMPLFYSIQVLYLIKFTPKLTYIHWAAVLLFKAAGIYIFLKSNLEKAAFRSDPKKMMKRDVKVVFTADGRNLLADGWWGRLRHPNYLGDILVSISWALPAGCSHIAPWLYPIYLIAMLVYFAKEDDKRCAKKYGLSWDEYKARVKYIIFPYVY